MEYRVIKISWAGYTVEVLLCAECELPEGTEDTGKTEIVVQREAFACYSCLLKMNQLHEKHAERLALLRA